jgi:hypothetical protein
MKKFVLSSGVFLLLSSGLSVAWAELDVLVNIDEEGRLLVAANQADELVVLNANGRVIAKFGDFLGIQSDGSPKGLLFPASLVVVRGRVFVTNLALPLTGATGDEPEKDVTRFTISFIPTQALK